MLWITVSGRHPASFSAARTLALSATMIAALNLVACADDDAPKNSDESLSTLEIVGKYANSFGGTETINEAVWKTESDGFPAFYAKIDAFDNQDNFAITQNSSDAEYSPNAFNKIVWTEPDASGAFFYCTVAFGLASAEEAAATEDEADAGDLESGCMNFSWTQLTPQP